LIGEIIHDQYSDTRLYVSVKLSACRKLSKYIREAFFTLLALPDEPPINWRILFIYLSEGRVWLSEAQASFKPAAK
jgi:hypothetical protein